MAVGLVLEENSEQIGITPVVGQNFDDRSQEAGKAAYSREYGWVHASAMSSDGG